MLPKVKDYKDYRIFLYAHHEAMKETRSTWSLGVWSQKLGGVSKAALIKILKGERSPGPKMTERFIKYFKFNEKEETHFRRLIQIRKSRGMPDVASAVMDTLQQQESAWTDFDPGTQVLMRKWYYAPALALWLVTRRNPDPKAIAERLGGIVSAPQILQAIEEMEAAGLLSADRNGDWKVAKNWQGLRTNRMTTISTESWDIQRGWLQGLLAATSRQIDHIDPKLGDFRVATIAMNAEKFAEARELIAQFELKFASLFSDAKGDEIFQLQMQFLPFTCRQR